MRSRGCECLLERPHHAHRISSGRQVVQFCLSVFKAHPASNAPSWRRQAGRRCPLESLRDTRQRRQSRRKGRAPLSYTTTRLTKQRGGRFASGWGCPPLTLEKRKIAASSELKKMRAPAKKKFPMLPPAKSKGAVPAQRKEKGATAGLLRHRQTRRLTGTDGACPVAGCRAAGGRGRSADDE